jgi:hypothetical protein
VSVLDGFLFWIGKAIAELVVFVVVIAAIGLGYLILWWLCKKP